MKLIKIEGKTNWFDFDSCVLAATSSKSIGAPYDVAIYKTRKDTYIKAKYKKGICKWSILTKLEAYDFFMKHGYWSCVPQKFLTENEI